MVSRYFPLEEYAQRQQKVMDEMQRRGYEVAVIWGRGGGSHDRCGDLIYLANYYSPSSGQEPDNDLLNARSFSALILAQGREPELHIDMPEDRKNLLAVDNVQWHYDPIKGVAEALKRHKVQGRVALVGNDFFPLKYWRQFEHSTSDITWEPEDDLVQVVRRIKSPRELDCYREGAAIVTRALNRLLEGLIACKPESEAAAEAAREVIRAGGSYLMIPCSHGDAIESWCRNPQTGYSTDAPKVGDMVRGWVLGPIFQRYYLDPGRTAVAGGRPSSDQKALIEACAAIVNRIINEIRPGVSVMEMAKLGEKLTAEAGGGKDKAAEQWPLYGHSVGLFWENPYIGTQMCTAEDTFEKNMVFGVEAFLGKEGVGAAGFEQNIIVTHTGTELLTTTPLFWW